MPSPRSEFLAGIQAELPILLGVVPFGMVYGVLALDAGMSIVVAQAMSCIIFAGSAQIVMTQLVATDAPWFIMLVTMSLINLRHILYSASVAPYLKQLHPLWKGLLAYLLTDEAYAVTITHYQQDSPLEHKHWYFLGAGLALWSIWQASTAAGIFLGAYVPDSWSLDFTVALTFIALIVPALHDRANILAALTAGVVAVIAVGLPLNLGLMVAALVGIFVGFFDEVLSKYAYKKDT